MASPYATISRRLNRISYIAPRVAGRAAFDLFIHPARRMPVRPAEEKAHAEADVETLSVDGADVKTYRWAAGPRQVLLIHGFESRASCFAAFVPALTASGFTVIGYDAPGHGDSGGNGATIVAHRAVTAAIQERHGPFNALIGHSFGAICGFYAVRTGFRAERIAAISGVSEFGALPDTFCGQLGLRPAISRELRRRTERFFYPETDIWQRFSPVYRPGEITGPVLIVHDENDREVPVEHARRIAAAYDGRARLITTSGLGHRRILADPAVIGEALEFLSASDGNGNEDHAPD